MKSICCAGGILLDNSCDACSIYCPHGCDSILCTLEAVIVYTRLWPGQILMSQAGLTNLMLSSSPGCFQVSILVDRIAMQAPWSAMGTQLHEVRQSLQARPCCMRGANWRESFSPSVAVLMIAFGGVGIYMTDIAKQPSLQHFQPGINHMHLFAVV